MTKPKDEIQDEPTIFDNPDELMPIPDRLKERAELRKETLEVSVRSPAPQSGALVAKPVSGIVEPDSLTVIRARRDAHLAKMRR